MLFNDNLAWTFNNLRLKGVIDCSSAGASPCEEAHTFASWSQFLLRQNQGGQEQGVCSTLSVLPPTSQP